MLKHFVNYLSPGTMFAEENTEEIPNWDCIPWATARASEITQRYNAKPYGFYFTSRTRGENDFDSRETARSPTYFLGGTVRTAAEVLAGTDPKEEILRANVENNGIKRILVNTNSWKITLAMGDEDVLLQPLEKECSK